ncbi:hypothetical protein [Stenotrophomonas maltophilia]|uniref:hypothetical protein n=1 Tax=Stenotrophomonas maltophilia TaxID=40324 RepID=UPI00387728C8
MLAGMHMRMYFSLLHAQMAAFHARSAAGMPLDGSEEAAIALSAHVSGAVMCASAFIEATANELSEKDEKANALSRLNKILIDANVEAMNESDTTFHSAKTLFDLRNRLTHYKHDWLDWGTKDMVGPNNLYDSPLYERLQSSFEFLPASVHYIPRFLSPDCALWAITSATSFLDDFYTRLGMRPNHDHLRDRIEVNRLWQGT